MSKKLFIQLIADYCVGDPAFAEVVQKLKLLDPECEVFCTSVPKFSTLATGFWTAQLAQVNEVGGMVIYTNTAPRKDNKEIRQKNEGERLVYTKLGNGIEIIGVNAGYCFSFVKPYTKSFRVVNVANKGSQFRSRDFYPEAVVGLAQKKSGFLGDELDINSIPDTPQHRIAWIDGYGNLKSTVRVSQCRYNVGQALLVTLNGMKRTAFYTDGSFNVREGELAFAPGSSGGEDRFMEIFLRGLSAWKEFGKPHIEDEFVIQKE